MENREGLLVMHQMKVHVASADGTRLELRTFQPGEFIKRSDFDRFPARSQKSMRNVGFVRDPLAVKLDPVTGQPEAMPTPRPARTVLRAPRTITQLDPKTGDVVMIQDPGGLDYRLQRQTATAGAGASVVNLTDTQTDVPSKRKRGRPRKVKE